MISGETVGLLTENIFWPELWQFIAQYSQEGFGLLLVGLWLWWFYKRNRKTWQPPAIITIGQLISYPLSEILQNIFQRLRPYHAANYIPLTGAEPYVSPSEDFSLPSNHAVATAVFAYVFYRYGNQYSKWLLITFTVLVGLSRVFVGVHYPLDIVTGWFVGGACGVLAAYLEKKIYPRLTSILPFST